MANIDELTDAISQIIAERRVGDVSTTTLDFRYAYREVGLDQKTSKQSNFSLEGEN